MKVTEFLERYVFVRKCVSCRTLLGYDEKDEAFCDSCRIRFERAKVRFCRGCSRSMIECECMPGRLSRIGMLTLRRLTEYNPEKLTYPEQQIIYFLKRNKNRRVVHFIASQLSFRIGELLSSNDIDEKDAVLSAIPRSVPSLSKYGFDQSELIARELSELTGIEFLPLIVRSDKRSGQQKKLDLSQRAKNAKGSFLVDNDSLALLDGRAVIIFDDVVTSGASMAEAVRILHNNGVKSVYGLCIASTEI